MHRFRSLIVAAALAAALPSQDAGSAKSGSAGAGASKIDDELQSDVEQALDLARGAILAHLDKAAGKHVRPGVLALVMLAAIHDGVDQSEKGFVRAVKRLSNARCAQTYDIALRLMVMQDLPAFPDRRDIAKKDVKRLLRHRDEGAFGYMINTGQWDLSNTQYAALGLRSARAMQVAIPKKVWSALAKNIAEQQDVDGSFGYQKLNSGFPGYASMTAAGIAVMAVCRQALGDGHTLTPKLTKKIELGWRYFDNNVDRIGAVKEHWAYYFLYGLERAAILTDVDRVAGKSWYELGARMLLDHQLPGGGWVGEEHGERENNLPFGRGSAIATSFAVLFLRRKFQKDLVPITPKVMTLPQIGPNSLPKHVKECAAELKRRGKAAMPDIVWALRSKIRNQREAAATALVGITGKDFGYDTAADPATQGRAVKQVELWYLRNR
ncbi:MAG: hypothetical protein NXI31_04190 [bacterium]|nr:hypothetical protein [bacterium]